jgi:hypothetical protein
MNLAALSGIVELIFITTLEVSVLNRKRRPVTDCPLRAVLSGNCNAVSLDRSVPQSLPHSVEALQGTANRLRDIVSVFPSVTASLTAVIRFEARNTYIDHLVVPL